MWGRFRPPLVVVALALLGLIALLATLQYRWLGQISDAERDRMRAVLETRATEFGRDFDRELTRAYLLFQPDPTLQDQGAGERMALRFDRWQATARFPRLLKNVYVVSRDSATNHLRRLNVSERTLEIADWPASMADWRDQLGEVTDSPPKGGAGALVIRRIAAPVWERVPAIVVPMPMVFFSERGGRTDMRLTPDMPYAILEIDRPYVTGELLPTLAKQHLQNSGEGTDYQLAVVSRAAGNEVIYGSSPGFRPTADAVVDKKVDLFQVRTPDFSDIAAEVRRFSTFTAAVGHSGNMDYRAGATATLQVHDARVTDADHLSPPDRMRVEREAAGLLQGRMDMGGTAPLSIVVQQTGPGAAAGAAAALGAAASRLAAASGPKWMLMVKHPSGSLEAAVNTARRRNLMVSSTILAVLGASVGLLIMSTRRAQNLARLQMEFVAAVSHELRTPLAVIRSAGENLADGVVHDEQHVKKYGNLVRSEGRRLTEMVEQILEFAGIHSGQRGFALRPIDVRALLEEVVHASRTLVDEARVTVEYDVPDGLAPVLGDEAALRRVFQNLVGNALKYGGRGAWIGLRARPVGREVHIAVADRGIGIAPSEHVRIFEPFYRAPDVIAAQIQGAGLGLSLVKRIVEAHGGRVAVRSTPGAGSEFTVVLPAAAEEPIGREALPRVDSEHERLRPARG